MPNRRIVIASGGDWELPPPNVRDVNEFINLLFPRRLVENLGHYMFKNRYHDVEDGVNESWMKFRDYSVEGRVRFMRGYARKHLHDEVRHAQAHSYTVCCLKSYMLKILRRHSHTKRVGGVEFELQIDHHEDSPFISAEFNELFEYVRRQVCTEQWDVWIAFSEGKNLEEISKEFGISMNRARTYVVETLALIESAVSRFIDDGLAAV